MRILSKRPGSTSWRGQCPFSQSRLHCTASSSQGESHVKQTTSTSPGGRVHPLGHASPGSRGTAGHTPSISVLRLHSEHITRVRSLRGCHGGFLVNVYREKRSVIKTRSSETVRSQGCPIKKKIVQVCFKHRFSYAEATGGRVTREPTVTHGRQQARR